MVWDDTKTAAPPRIDSAKIKSADWNDMVTDQKERLVEPSGATTGDLIIYDGSNFTVLHIDPNRRYLLKGGDQPHTWAHQYGYFGGGYDGSNWVTTMEHIDTFTAIQNSVDTGSLTCGIGPAGLVGNTLHYFSGNGSIHMIVADIAVQNSSHVGSLSLLRHRTTGVSGSTYGFFGGGYTGSYQNVIDYIVIDTGYQNAVDTGDLTAVKASLGGVSGSTYGFFGGGVNSTYIFSDIEYIQLDTKTQNATHTGDLTEPRYGVAGVSGSTYGFYGGGNLTSIKDTIDYIDLTTTTGNATDRGTLTVARYMLTNSDGVTYGFFSGGYDGTQPLNIIDYIDTEILVGNAVDSGDLTVARQDLAGV